MKKRIELLLLLLLLGCSYGMGQIKRHTTTTRICATTEYAYLQFPQLKSVWKPSYEHVLVLQSEDSIRPFMKLEELLSDIDVYTPRNTLIVCTEDNEKYVKELSGKITVLPLNTLLLTKDGPTFSEGTLLRLSNNEEGYEFKYVPTQIY